MTTPGPYPDPSAAGQQAPPPQPYPGQPYAGQPYPGPPGPPDRAWSSAGPPPAGYPPYGYGYPPVPAPPTDVLAILGLVGAFVLAPAGLVLSILGYNRTRGTADRTGHGLALAGIIVSSLVLLGWLAYLVFVVTMFGTIMTVVTQLPSPS